MNDTHSHMFLMPTDHLHVFQEKRNMDTFTAISHLVSHFGCVCAVTRLNELYNAQTIVACCKARHRLSLTKKSVSAGTIFHYHCRHTLYSYVKTTPHMYKQHTSIYVLIVVLMCIHSEKKWIKRLEN